MLKLICSGLTNAEIADELHLSLRTVEGHRSKLISRTGVKNSIQLVLYVFRHKLFDLS
ncbi:MAG: LuxR C-terminal-related transcriptional regulator [Bacteroidales bacterium]